MKVEGNIKKYTIELVILNSLFAIPTGVRIITHNIITRNTRNSYDRNTRNSIARNTRNNNARNIIAPNTITTM